MLENSCPDTLVLFQSCHFVAVVGAVVGRPDTVRPGLSSKSQCQTAREVSRLSDSYIVRQSVILSHSQTVIMSNSQIVRQSVILSISRTATQSNSKTYYQSVRQLIIQSEFSVGLILEYIQKFKYLLTHIIIYI